MIQSYKTSIDKALDSCLAEFNAPNRLYGPVHYLFEAGGKRVRPILTALACEIVGGECEHSIPAAVSVELLHNFTLVHDDIMDRSPMRRGRKTVHEKYDENTAILSGDVMIGVALKQVEKSAVYCEKPLRLMTAFSSGLIEVCEGQSLDVTLAERNDVSIDEYFVMIEKKTAKLLEMSVAIGAIIGGGTDEQIENLATFAREVGIAFQLQDDLLDLTGSEEFGKTPGGDLLEGKRTWLILRTRDILAEQGEKASTEHLRIITSFFERGRVKPKGVSAMIALMTDLGVLEEADALIRKYTDDAFRHLHLLPPSAARDSMEELANKLMVRTH